jgi:hypothetical protein
MDIDLPWEEDPLRDFPDLREHFLDIWHVELKSLNANYNLITGSNELRLQNAIKCIDAFLIN